uniref:Major facilitator superfamily (MFS) profile domain-containing protein n=1 Tax=Ciona savignyi TaxID=51511 RepID=H2Z9A5_CIOSA
MKLQQVVSIVSACLECILFGGVIFGWPSLEYVLKRENYFSYLCSNNSNGTIRNVTLKNIDLTLINGNLTSTQCGKSSEMLNLVFTVALGVSQILLPLGGYILDTYGTWIQRSLASIAIMIASVMLAVSSATNSGILFPSMVLLAIGGFNILMSNIQLGKVAGKAQTSVITLINGSFNSGTFVFLMFKIAYDSGIDLKSISIAYVIISVYPLVSTFLLMPRKWFSDTTTNTRYGIFELMDLVKAKCFCYKSVGSAVDMEDHTNSPERLELESQVQNDNEAGKEMYSESGESHLYWSVQLYYSLLNLRMIFFLGSFSTWISNIESEANVGRLTNILGILLVLSICISPAHGILTDGTIRFCIVRGYSKQQSTWAGLLVSVFTTSLLTVLVSVTVALKHTYSSFILFVLARSFVYASTSTFIAFAFPSRHFGTLYGITTMLGGISGFLQFALFSLGISVDKDFTIVNYSMIGMSACTFLHSMLTYKNLR